jgi:uncharacterized protein YjcR
VIKPRKLPQLVHTADIARHFGVSLGTVRRWACEDRWNPHGTRHQRQWDLREAQASWDKRHRAGGREEDQADAG